MNLDNLLALKDDMIAFIEGHGMRYFPAVIPEETPRIWWNDTEAGMADRSAPEGARESWKDFVEMAKSAGAPLVCIGEDVLDKTTLDVLASELEEVSSEETFGPEIERLDRLSRQVGKLGHIELAFAHQGILFVHESATDWYRSYREMVDTIEDLQEIIHHPYDNEEPA
ncbi:MAG TPA: hypothetical protein VN670_02690 [Acidobacteriaceae bacterium]|nr:hypothetical protein [Acidobacteriaceae bacterium]